MSASPAPTHRLHPKPPNSPPTSIPATNTQPSSPFHPSPQRPHWSTSPDTTLRHCSLRRSLVNHCVSPILPSPYVVSTPGRWCWGEAHMPFPVPVTRVGLCQPGARAAQGRGCLSAVSNRMARRASRYIGHVRWPQYGANVGYGLGWASFYTFSLEV